MHCHRIQWCKFCCKSSCGFSPLEREVAVTYDAILERNCCKIYVASEICKQLVLIILLQRNLSLTVLDFKSTDSLICSWFVSFPLVFLMGLFRILSRIIDSGCRTFGYSCVTNFVSLFALCNKYHIEISMFKNPFCSYSCSTVLSGKFLRMKLINDHPLSSSEVC